MITYNVQSSAITSRPSVFPLLLLTINQYDPFSKVAILIVQEHKCQVVFYLENGYCYIKELHTVSVSRISELGTVLIVVLIVVIVLWGNL